MRRVLLLSVLCLCSAQALALTHKLNYRDVISYAIARSPSLRQQARALHISELERKNALAKFFPNLDVENTIGTGHGATSQFAAGSQSSLGFSVTQSLFNNGDNITNYQKSRDSQQFAMLQYQQARDQLIVQVLKAYINYSRNLELLKLNKQIYHLFQQQFVNAKALYQQGLKTQTDELNLDIQANTAKLSVANSQQAIVEARNQLLQTIGADQQAAKWQFIPLAIPKLSRQQVLLSLPVKQFRQYRLLSIQKDINQLTVELQRHLFRPNIFISAGGDYSTPAPVAGALQAYTERKQWGWFGLVKIDVNLFDAGTRWRNIDIATEQTGQISDQLQEQLLTELQQMRNVVSDSQTQQHIIHVSQHILQAAAQNLKLVTQQYHAGNLQYLDLIQALQSVQITKRTNIVARYQLAQDQYQYQFFTGRLYHDIFPAS